MIKHCYKDTKPSDNDDTVCESLDEVIAVQHLDSLKKKNVLEIMFPDHSILLSFGSFTTMERWQSELANMTSKNFASTTVYIHTYLRVYIPQLLQ